MKIWQSVLIIVASIVVLGMLLPVFTVRDKVQLTAKKRAALEHALTLQTKPPLSPLYIALQKLAVKKSWQKGFDGGYVRVGYGPFFMKMNFEETGCKDYTGISDPYYGFSDIEQQGFNQAGLACAAKIY